MYQMIAQAEGRLIELQQREASARNLSRRGYVTLTPSISTNERVMYYGLLLIPSLIDLFVIIAFLAVSGEARFHR